MDDSVFEYLICSSPLIVGQLLIPPLSYFGRKEILPPALEEFLDLLYNFLPDEFRNQSFIQSLGLHVNTTFDKQQYRWISHMFVHGTYSHLFNNLLALIQLGYPIYLEYGVVGLYGIFFFGGISAALPSKLYTKQRDVISQDFHKLTSTTNQFLPKILIDNWNDSMKRLGIFIVNNVNPIYIGSSGSV